MIKISNLEEKQLLIARHFIDLKEKGNDFQDKDIFDFAEDVEYGLRELIEVAINKGGMKNG